MATQESIECYLALDRSDRPRTYLFGPSPDDERELWYFEAVDDNGALIAIRQLTIGADGTRHAYSPQHIEDEWGFLTDQPIDYADELTPCDAAIPADLGSPVDTLIGEFAKPASQANSGMSGCALPSEHAGRLTPNQ